MNNYYDKYVKYKSKYLNLKGGNNGCAKCINDKIDDLSDDQKVLKESVNKNFFDIDTLVDNDIIGGNTLKSYIQNIYGLLVSEPVLYQLNNILNKKTGIDYDINALFYSDKINSYYDDIRDIIIGTKNIIKNMDYIDNSNYVIHIDVIESLINNYKTKDIIKESTYMNQFIDDINKCRILLDSYDGHTYGNAYKCTVKNIEKYMLNKNLIGEICNSKHADDIYKKKKLNKNIGLEKFVDYHKIHRDVTVDMNMDNLLKYSNMMNKFFTAYQKNYLDMEKNSNIEYIKSINQYDSYIQKIINQIKTYVQNNDIKIIDDTIRKLKIMNKDLNKLEILLDKLHDENNLFGYNYNNFTNIFYIIKVPNVDKLIHEGENTMNKLSKFMNNKRSISKVMKIFSGRTKIYSPEYDEDDENKYDSIYIDDYFIILKLVKYNIELFKNNYSKNKDHKYFVNIIDEFVNGHINIPIDDYKIDSSRYRIIDLYYPIGRKEDRAGHGVLLIKYGDMFVHFDSNYYTEHYSIDAMKNMFGDNKFKLLGPNLKTSPLYGIQPKNEGYSFNLDNICYISRNKNPLGNEGGFCASWAQYVKIMLTLNNDKIHSYDDMVEMVRYIIHDSYTDNNTQNEKNKLFIQLKLFKSMLLELYILVDHGIINKNTLSKIIPKKQVDNIDKIIDNIRVNIDKIRPTNKYVYNILT